MAASALMTMMFAAARKAGRSLARDFGEVTHLQVSLKGPSNFVSAADHRAEQVLYDELSKARHGYSFLMEERGLSKGRTNRMSGSSILSTAPRISCTAFRISPSPSACSARAIWSPG